MTEIQYTFDTYSFPQESFDEKNITKLNKDALTNIGLPDWVAPHLYFGEFDGEYLPFLENWAWINDWKEKNKELKEQHRHSYVIGSGPNEEPIVLIPSDSRVYILTDSAELMNSDIMSLIHTLNEFSKTIDEAMKEDEWAFENKTISHELVASFLSSLSNLDPQLKSNDSFWLVWGNILMSGGNNG